VQCTRIDDCSVKITLGHFSFNEVMLGCALVPLLVWCHNIMS
jgi:hypothetical protein